MKDFNKAGIIAAMYTFRQELSGMNIAPDKKIKLMEDFKAAYERSMDSDLAMDAIQDKIMAAAGSGKRQSAFKDAWKKMQETDVEKGLWSQFMGNREERHFRDFIDDKYRAGMTEEQILQALTNSGMAQTGSLLSTRQRDILRMLVVDQKVKLRDEGVIKMINSFVRKHGK